MSKDLSTQAQHTAGIGRQAGAALQTCWYNGSPYVFPSMPPELPDTDSYDMQMRCNPVSGTGH